MNQKVERDVIRKNVSRLAVYEGSMLDEKSRFFWKDKKKRRRDSVFYVTMKREEYARTTMLIGIGMDIYIVEGRNIEKDLEKFWYDILTFHGRITSR